VIQAARQALAKPLSSLESYGLPGVWLKPTKPNPALESMSQLETMSLIRDKVKLVLKKKKT
jgi:hypothetical protein